MLGTSGLPSCTLHTLTHTHACTHIHLDVHTPHSHSYLHVHIHLLTHIYPLAHSCSHPHMPAHTVVCWNWFVLLHENQLLNFQEFCESFIKHSHYKSYKLTIKQIILQTKLINTQSSSLPNYFPAFYIICVHEALKYLSIVSEIPQSGTSSLPSSTISDITMLKISHHGSIYAQENSNAQENSKTINRGFLFSWRAGC